MMVELSSPHFSVKIKSHGAEVCSVKNTDGTEFMWQANPDVWARHAPVLFPIVGKLKDNRFDWEDGSYELPQHGFARDMEFELLSNEKNTCVFRLTSSKETRSKFPFDFEFYISHQLTESTLTTSYKIKNLSAHTGYFSVGAHPGFNCPIATNETFEDYYLEFEPGSYKRTVLSNGLLSGTTSDLALINNRLPLTSDLFNDDALVFENNQINNLILGSLKSARKITLVCKGWPFFGIWSKKGNRNFICLEPWYGITDSENARGDLKSKKGIIALNVDGEFNCSFSVTFS